MIRLGSRLLKAYRPLYQRGLLMDGPCRWPTAEAPDDSTKPPARRRQRVLLVALTGLTRIDRWHRRKR